VRTTLVVQAFVLAAGEGRRLRPLTDDVPKPMIPIRGRPILEHNVRMLARYGASEIVINLHHRGDTIRAHFGDGGRFGVKIEYSEERELLGTAGALNAVRERFRAPFFLIYGDNLTTCDLGRLRARHREGAIATVALFEREDVAQSGVAALDGNDRITAFVEKPAPGTEPSHWVSAGVMVLDPAIFDFIPSSGPSDIGRDVLPAALAAGRVVAGYRMSERLWWIDSHADYDRTSADPALAQLC
jgi:NDP-sugar pyrophosphorylase family protein